MRRNSIYRSLKKLFHTQRKPVEMISTHSGVRDFCKLEIVKNSSTFDRKFGNRKFQLSFSLFNFVPLYLTSNRIMMALQQTVFVIKSISNLIMYHSYDIFSKLNVITKDTKSKYIISNDNSIYLYFCNVTSAFDLPSLFIYSLLSNFLL